MSDERRGYTRGELEQLMMRVDSIAYELRLMYEASGIGALTGGASLHDNRDLHAYAAAWGLRVAREEIEKIRENTPP